MLSLMMAVTAGWWFWWLYKRGESQQKSLEEVCQWMGDQYATLQDNPYAALFGYPYTNTALLTLRQQIQTALFAGYDLTQPLRELYRTLRRLRLEMYARQQMLRLFCLHQLLLLGIALIAKYLLSQAGLLPTMTNPYRDSLELGLCLFGAGCLTAWMHVRMPTLWAWQKGWTQSALIWMQQLLQGEDAEGHHPSLGLYALPNWVEEQFVHDEVAQKQFASAYPFYELSIYFLLLAGVFGRSIWGWGQGISL